MKVVTGGKIWLGALMQITVSTVFMLAFGFPRVLIPIFAGLILVGTILSSWMKSRAAVASRRSPQQPLSHPILFRIVSLGIVACSFAFICILLFGFVIFMNSWNRWHQYEGQPYHRSDFQVTQVYYQKHSKGGADIYARGTVEGQREWMGLIPYLHSTPHDEAELDSRVPPGTTIPIYLFPDLKGRARVQVATDVPPAEASHRMAMNALNYGFLGLIVTAGVIFVLSRLRRLCFVETETAFQQVGAGQSS